MDVRTQVPTLFGDQLSQHGELWKNQLQGLRQKFGASIEETRFPGEDAVEVPVVFVKLQALIPLLRYLRDEPGFEYGFLSDITATDEETQPRFELVYQLFSHARKARFRVKARISEGESAPTATVIWPAANWAEREVFDMFGIRFEGHPDLRRILMDERWEGFPLRKDYPLRGYQLFPDPMPIQEKLLQ